VYISRSRRRQRSSHHGTRRDPLRLTLSGTRLRLELLEDRRLLSLTPEMLADVAFGPGFNPFGMTAVGSTVFFEANDGTHGFELWKSDGTAGGTAMVKDIEPGDGHSYPQRMTEVNGTLFFMARTAATGWELWKSDGTAAGTVLVKDIGTGAGDSYPAKLTNANGTLFFSANDGTNGEELWKSNGTASGTVLVKDMVPGTAGSFPSGLTNINGTLFFALGDTLWTSDGTASGTVLIKDVEPAINGATLTYLTNVSGTLFFRGDGEPWKSDGTMAGTVLVKDIMPGSLSSFPSQLTNVYGTLFFEANDGVNGFELWKSDGTTAGTALVNDIVPGTGGSSPNKLTNVNGTLFFTAFDSSNGRELWKSDGTASGTTLVKGIQSGPSSSSPTYLTNVGGILLFSANDGANGFELWKSDGTEAGTALVMDIVAGADDSFPLGLINANGTLFFRATGGSDDLWKSDGTTAGTTRLTAINADPTASSSPSTFTNVNGTVFFRASDRNHAAEPWKTDGTAAGTVRLRDVASGSTGSLPGRDLFQPNLDRPFVNVGGTMFFAAGTTNDIELWKTDGTFAGTQQVKDIRPGTSNSSDPRYLVNVNGTLFFSANNGTNGRELWKSDGTAVGTVMVKDIRSGPNSSNPGSRIAVLISLLGGMQNVNGTLFFTANDGSTGVELWKSDGTEAGTVLVKDIRPGSSSSAPQSFVNLNGTLFFTATDLTSGYELWRSDGSTAGTVLVKDILPGSGSGRSSGAYPALPVVNVNGTLFFQANDGTNGFELWKSDETAAGTTLVKDINPGTAGSSPSNLVNVNGKLFFTANDGTSGTELWKSDGSGAGTTLVKDTFPGTTGSAPTALANVNGALCFRANDGATGQELWRSDGSAAGTVLMMDINPGSASSSPDNLAAIDGTLYFAADDGVHGVEPWTVFVPRFVRVDPILLAQPEGASGTVPFVFTVSLSAPSDQTVTVAYATTDGTATVVDNDYAGVSGTLTFIPGQTILLVTVLANGDIAVEPDEAFTLNLSDPVNASITGAVATGTIVNDDALVSATRLFYKDSTKWNVTNGATFSDDNAIAPDKTAYLPGSGTSTFFAVSSYDKGVNGIMVDLSGWHGALGINDFQFKRGNNNSPSAWATATAPTTVTVRSGAGVTGSDRTELLWDNNQSVKKQWLEVIVEGNDTVGGFNTNTGLAASYVFYFGSAIGDAGVSNSGAFQVTSGDEINARNNPKSLGNPATRSDVNDFNRNGLVDSGDQIIARNNTTSLGNQLKFLVVGAGGPFAPESEASSNTGIVGSSPSQSNPTEATLAASASAERSVIYGDIGIASTLASATSAVSTSSGPPMPVICRTNSTDTALTVQAYFEQLAAEEEQPSHADRSLAGAKNPDESTLNDSLDGLLADLVVG
jgi:ELWxxDGT repeat protein